MHLVPATFGANDVFSPVSIPVATDPAGHEVLFADTPSYPGERWYLLFTLENTNNRSNLLHRPIRMEHEEYVSTSVYSPSVSETDTQHEDSLHATDSNN